MSAIIGILNLDGSPVEPGLLKAMVDSLAHRGPDGHGLWLEGSVALGHQALWTTPEASLESLPMPAFGRFVITCDARLDNREDLLAAVRHSCRLSQAAPDCALIVAAYEKWGEDCVEHLRGDFAFAIWDQRERKLFCARDHMGVKPFYYAVIPGRCFLFATEIKAILRIPGISDAVNEEKVADAFVYLVNNPVSTYYSQISRLPAAHCLSLKNSVSTRRYWRLNPDRELRLNSDQEYAEGFYDRFSQAVIRRMRSSDPVGSMLSGGLDSSSVTCVARDWLKARGKPKLHTFSAVFDEVEECDERPYINTVIAQGHCLPSFIIADSLSPLNNFELTMWHLDEPLKAGNLYLASAAYRKAQELGVRVVLNGFDGDTTVSHGLGRLAELADSKRWLALGAELFRGARNIGGEFWLACWWSWFSNRQPVAGYVKRLSCGIMRRIRRPQPPKVSTETSIDILNPDLLERLKFREILQNPMPRPRSERERHFRLLERELMTKSVELMGHSSAAFDVEVRFPFMDVGLIEYCLSLPSDQKLRSGYTRFVMHQGMKGVLPDKIQKRGGKSNLTPSFEKGLFKFERENLPEIILREAVRLTAYLNLERIKECLDRFQHGVATEDDIIVLWTTLDLALWLGNRHTSSRPQILKTKEVK
jgi:asparagine synthase (glutamine-hydrolysing)